MKLRLKELRKRKRWSQSKLSKISGVARGYISEIESGKYTNPTADVICRLCKALGCTPSDLIICEEERDDFRTAKRRKTNKSTGSSSSKDNGSYT